MRILGWSKFLSLRERLKNEAIKKRAGLAKISDVVARFRFTMVIERHNFDNKRNH